MLLDEEPEERRQERPHLRKPAKPIKENHQKKLRAIRMKEKEPYRRGKLVGKKGAILKRGKDSPLIKKLQTPPDDQNRKDAQLTKKKGNYRKKEERKTYGGRYGPPLTGE